MHSTQKIVDSRTEIGKKRSLSLTNLLEVRDLSVEFQTHEGIVQAVNHISFSVVEGETLGIVGESGSGKTVTMLSVLGLLPVPMARVSSGQVFFMGEDLLKLPEENMRLVRGAKLAMIFQDPMTSLNPVLPVGLQISEAITSHLKLTKSQALSRTRELLELVGIPGAKDRLKDYPHQFSGGMRQRVMIAMAVSCGPRLLVADEPTTALDVTIQAQIVDMVKRLQKELDMAVIWITHDLGLVARLARRVIVMYAGYIMEQASVSDLYYSPRHPYTIGLLGSLPRLEDDGETMLTSIPGQPPDMIGLPAGCPFLPRCTYAVEKCKENNPLLSLIEPEHWVACAEVSRTQGAWKHGR
jgi:oligopeptide transport system ATP-binding protein